MGFFDFLKSEITSVGKNDTFSKGELANLLKKDNGKDLLEEGAENGNLECQQLLYTIHMIGAKIDKFNRDKFEYYTKLAAHQNDATAQFNHAKNIFDSIEEIKPEAMEKNGGVAIDSILSIQQKLEEAVFWYKKSGQNGNKQGLDNANNIEVHLLKGWIKPLVKEYDEKLILKRLSEISNINSKKSYSIEVDPINKIWTYNYKFSEDEYIEARELIARLHFVGSYLVREKYI